MVEGPTKCSRRLRMILNINHCNGHFTSLNGNFYNIISYVVILQRYVENNQTLKQGMKEMGFLQIYSEEENPQGYLTTAFRHPDNPLFVFEEFQNRLSDYGEFN